MFTPDTIQRLRQLETPFYYYDEEILQKTLDVVSAHQTDKLHVHYAVKANSNARILSQISTKGLGADCVSGNEVLAAVAAGFSPDKIVFAGVGKADWEIKAALEKDIYCFNCESVQELEVINEIASGMGKVANIALRLNPSVNAHTHHYITTGLEENKFGISLNDLNEVLVKLTSLKNLRFKGIHFHIGSQITDLQPFKELCVKVNDVQKWLDEKRMLPEDVNVGGGLGVNYFNPDEETIVDFDSYFSIFKSFLNLHAHQKLHFELGRAIVANCGSLISKVLYVKPGKAVNFLILDAGMTELIRPALYQAYHKIENLSAVSDSELEKYDVVGPICESSDCFGKSILLPHSKRGDLFAIRTAGAYGEVMSSGYNLRGPVKTVFSSNI